MLRSLVGSEMCIRDRSFVNSRPFVTSNIIGATTMEQLKENIDSVNIDFTDEMMERVDKIHNENPNPSP